MSPATILLVETHQDTREMYAEYLRAFRFRLIAADTTDEGLLRASDVDVVVTGIRVRGSFDGLELVRRLRRMEQTRETPVIVLTGCVFETDRLRAFDAGCDRFLPKPCLPHVLVATIHCLLTSTALRRSSRTA